MRKIYTYFLRGSFCIFCFLLFHLSSTGQVQTPRYISTGPNSNGFYEYLPAGYSTSSTKYPLIVFLHGSGELGNGGSDLPKVLDNGPPMLAANGQFPATFTVNGQTFSFIVISPQFVAWPTDNDVDDVIKYAVANYRVDTGRIYLTGLSMGGSAVWSYAPEPGHAQMLAAIVPIAGGTMYSGTAGAQLLSSASLPVFAAANLNDPTVASIETVDDINIINSVTPHINPPALDTIYNASGHGGWTQTYDPNNAMHNGLNIYQWMLQYSRDAATPPVSLPVTLTSFTAQLLDGAPQVQLAWTTSFEQNNHYFIIQRSADGQTFSNIDTVAAAPDAEDGHSYTALDAQPLAGPDYYRLAQVDLDGKSTYSGIREVTVTQGQQGLRISPNPADQSIVAELRNAATGTFQLRLMDVQGKTLRTWVYQKQDEYWSQTLDIGNLASGSYFLQAIGTTFREVSTFIKK